MLHGLRCNAHPVLKGTSYQTIYNPPYPIATLALCCNAYPVLKGTPYQVEGTARGAAISFVQAHLARAGDSGSDLSNAAREGLVAAKDAVPQSAVPAAATVQLGALIAGDVSRPVARETVAALEGVADPLHRLALSTACPAHIDDLVARCVLPQHCKLYSDVLLRSIRSIPTPMACDVHTYPCLYPWHATSTPTPVLYPFIPIPLLHVRSSMG